MSAELSAKTEMRRRLREQRRALTPEARRLAATRLAAQLLNTREFRASRDIACYLTNDGEIDTTDVIRHMQRLRKRCYVPALSRLTHDRLWFAPALPDAELVVNRLGILEPNVAT